MLAENKKHASVRKVVSSFEFHKMSFKSLEITKLLVKSFNFVYSKGGSSWENNKRKTTIAMFSQVE